MQQVFASRFAREITAVLILKVLVLGGLWYAFFSSPLDKGLSDSRVGDYLFETARPSADLPPNH